MKIVNSAEYLYGYANNERVLIKNTTEQICAFIMVHRLENVIITDIFDQLEIETSMGFIMTCRNQEYLAKELLPCLIPMQTGKGDVVEFVPYVVEDELNTIVLYNLDDVEICVIQTNLEHEEVVRKAITYRENGGGAEYDFLESLTEEGHVVKQIGIESVDYNNLDNYDLED